MKTVSVNPHSARARRQDHSGTATPMVTSSSVTRRRTRTCAPRAGPLARRWTSRRATAARGHRLGSVRRQLAL